MQLALWLTGVAIWHVLLNSQKRPGSAISSSYIMLSTLLRNADLLEAAATQATVPWPNLQCSCLPIAPPSLPPDPQRDARRRLYVLI